MQKNHRIKSKGHGESREKPTSMGASKEKIHKVMSEFAAGTLKSSDGSKVTKRTQAMAIALNSAREMQGGHHA